MKILELCNINFSYKNTRVINNLSYSFEEGKIYALVGHNGAGKTTILRIILGLLNHKSGSIKNNTNRNISYVPDQGGIYNFLSVKENINIFILFNDLNLEDDQIESLIAEWGLESKVNTQVRFLSSGQKQRLSLLIAFLNDSNLLLLDEPSNSIDINSQSILNTRLREFKKKGNTIIIATHDINLIEEIADIIIILNNGEIVLSSSLNEIDNLVNTYNEHAGNIYEV